MKLDFLSTAPRGLPSVIRHNANSLVLGGILFVTLILWSSAFVAIPIGLETVKPFPLIITRLLLSSIFLFPILVQNWKKTLKPRFKTDFWKIFLMAGSGIFLYLIFLTYGQRTVGAGQTSFIINLTPLFTGVLAAIFLKEVFHRRMLVGAVVALIGVSLLVFENGGGLSLNFDAVLVFLAMLASCVYYTVQRRLTKHYNAITLTALTIVGGTLFFIPFFPGTIEGLAGMSNASALAILYLGIGTIIPYAGWAWVLSKMEVGKAVLYLYSIPVISTLLGWLILDEAITPNLVFAGALILLGVMIGTGIIRDRFRKRKLRLVSPALKTNCPDAS